MFGNLKNKIGDVADLKKLTSPQALASMAGSRQRSSQHTPGSLTPRSRHSRQASTASLQGLGLAASPPRSPTDSSEFPVNHDRVKCYDILYNDKYLFFLKFSLSLLGWLPCWGLRVFSIWLSQLGFTTWNVMMIIIIVIVF